MIDTVVQALATRAAELGESRCRQLQSLLTHLCARQADSKWLLSVLSATTQGQHAFFAKSYKPPAAKSSKRSYLESLVVPNAHLLEDLPLPTQSSKRRGNIFVTTAQREEANLLHARSQFERVRQQLERQENLMQRL